MASQMEFSAYLAAIIAESGGLLDALGVHPSAPVADCPGWDVADLVRHTGSTHRWATAHLVAGLAGSISPAPAPDADVAASDLHEWFADGVTELVALLADCGPAQNCWTFGHPRSATFWARRMCHETAVHRVDAARAVGGPLGIDALQAADGVDEVLGVMFRLGLRSTAAPPSPTLHLHRTDPGDGFAEWLVSVDEDGVVVVDYEHGRGDVAVRAAASDLLLFLWGRIDVDDHRLEVHGDRQLARGWGALTP